MTSIDVKTAIQNGVWSENANALVCHSSKNSRGVCLQFRFRCEVQKETIQVGTGRLVWILG